jgi:hypothetical protein
MTHHSVEMLHPTLHNPIPHNGEMDGCKLLIASIYMVNFYYYQEEKLLD